MSISNKNLDQTRKIEEETSTQQGEILNTPVSNQVTLKHGKYVLQPRKREILHMPNWTINGHIKKRQQMYHSDLCLWCKCDDGVTTQK